MTLYSHDDVHKIKDAWERAIASNPGIVKDKWSMSVPYISPSSGSLMYWCGAWSTKKDFWGVYTDVLISIWDDLKDSGISFGLTKGESYVHLPAEQIKFLEGEDKAHNARARGKQTINKSLSTPHTFVEPDDAA